LILAGPGGSQKRAPERRIALFGGTFDPIHVGHIAVARATARRYHLDRILFIPAGCPPHKKNSVHACFTDRYAMVSLACAGQPRFVASLAESGPDHAGHKLFYSVDTVRFFKRMLQGSATQIYFLMGADSFLHIPMWKNYETLLGLCDFIVASRPGFDIAALRMVIPARLIAAPDAGKTSTARAIHLRRSTVHVLDTVSSDVSAKKVRKLLGDGQSIRGLVPPRVEDYITKQALYR
jgi:nicotinate-nucleotide adenylyltransferase